MAKAVALGLAASLGVLLAGSAAAQPTFQCTTPSGETRTMARIVGGQAVSHADFPWQVSVVSQYICGGSLVADRWVLTAAHCVDERVAAEDIIVRAGSSRLFSGGVTSTVARVVVYPGYSGDSHRHDIALLELSKPLRGPGIATIPFASNDALLAAPGTCAMVSGWGSVDPVDARAGRAAGRATEDDLLRAVDAPIVGLNECNVAYGGRVVESQLCAGYQEGGKDSCQGDSGGPLVVEGRLDRRRELVGVVSHGKGCASEGGYFGVYTRVASYADWIREVLRGP